MTTSLINYPPRERPPFDPFGSCSWDGDGRQVCHDHATRWLFVNGRFSERCVKHGPRKWGAAPAYVRKVDGQWRLFSRIHVDEKGDPIEIAAQDTLNDLRVQVQIEMIGQRLQSVFA